MHRAFGTGSSGTCQGWRGLGEERGAGSLGGLQGLCRTASGLKLWLWLSAGEPFTREAPCANNLSASITPSIIS